jgi:hypothetical protein
MDAKLFSAAARQRWFAVGVLLFFLLLSIQYTLKVHDQNRDTRSAFLRWREQVLALPDGINIYEKFNYPNPPIMALVLMPLMELPPLAGSLLWYYLKVLLALASLWAVFRLTEQPGRPFLPWAKLVVILLSLRPIMGDLMHGNVNLFILFTVVAALYAYRRGRDVLAGTGIGLAVACKVTPALFLPYFAWKRSWRALAGCGLGLALFLWLVPAALLGQERNAQLFGQWFHQMVTPFVEKGVVTPEHNNQSLPGMLSRLLTHSPSFSTYVNDVYTPLEYHNFANLNAEQVKWLLKGAMGLFALAVVFACRTPTQPRESWRLAAEFSLVLLGMLLFSERTWKHHCVTLMLPFAVVVYYLQEVRTSWRMRGYLAGTLAVVALLMATTSTGLVGPLDRAAKLAQVYGAYVWAYLLLAAALIVQLRRRDDVAVAQVRAEPRPLAA